jgi:hypothetical protein
MINERDGEMTNCIVHGYDDDRCASRVIVYGRCDLSSTIKAGLLRTISIPYATENRGDEEEV